ncbi:anthranilate synthase component I family protein [Candidatus Binatia bacterium]|nr:anthranilate synthase component I family protein [Candidatus Binatia bacterium]
MRLPIELPLGLPSLLRGGAGTPLTCVLDGAGPESWTDGRAIAGWGPRAVLRVAADGGATVRSGAGIQACAGDPFDLLDRFVAEWSPPPDRVRSPWAGGIVVALSYDLRRWVERVPARLADPLELPVLHAAAYDWFVVLDHRHGGVSLEVRPDAGLDASRLAERIAGGAPAALSNRGVDRVVRREFSKAAYAAAVRAALDYIAAGDIYQVNLAQRFAVTNPPAPLDVFAALQRHPMRFGAYVDAGDFKLLSNSPECYLTVRGEEVATYPIKGTRRRAADAAADAALAFDLRSDPKERAEHVMIVDLERNDLGRVCRAASVRVDALGRIESFPTLHHMVSRVSGRLRSDVSLAGLLRATFPGGSITGAPKVRAMQIIDALEPVPRGFYTGALGWIRADGSSVWSLLIRTAIATPGLLTYHAGGGIVADSGIDSEYEECLLKARPFFAAVEQA